MARVIALVLAAIGGAFVYAAFVLKGKLLLSVPSLDASTYYLTVALIAFVKAWLFASADTVAE